MRTQIGLKDRAEIEIEMGRDIKVEINRDRHGDKNGERDRNRDKDRYKARAQNNMQRLRWIQHRDSNIERE